MNKTNRTSVLVRASFLQKLGGYVNTQLIYVMAKWGIADLLATSSKSSRWLADELGIEPKRLHRILRGCVNAGLLVETELGEFATTPSTQLLESDRSDSLRDYALLTGEVWYPAWDYLLAGVETEQIPFELAFDTDYYTHFEQIPEVGTRFNQFMQARTIQISQALAKNYDFSDVKRVVDIGGGNGTLLQTVLTRYPSLKGILYDRPDVVAEAEQRLTTPEFSEQQLDDRLQYVGGNFLQTVPEDGDCYLLSQVFHNWADAQCTQILHNCHESMSPEAKLLILEQLIPEKLGSAMPAVEMDLMMLVLLQGHERTETAYRSLLASTGFEVLGTHSLSYSGLTIIEVQKQL